MATDPALEVLARHDAGHEHNVVNVNDLAKEPVVTHAIAQKGAPDPRRAAGRRTASPAATTRRGSAAARPSATASTTDGALEFASIETVKQCVVAGMGVSVVPSIAVDADVASGRLTRLSWREPFYVHTQLVWNARRSVSPAQAAFMAAAREVFNTLHGRVGQFG